MDRIALVIMDGVGIGLKDEGDMVWQASTPTLDALLAEYPHCALKAHGTAVGLPTDDDMGNSEVGHNALGCGQVYSQGAKLVNESIGENRIFESDTWNSLVRNCRDKQSTMHFIGLLSDGNVHSNISHLISMLWKVREERVARARVHILLDGRDVPSQSALTYVEQLEAELEKMNSDCFDACIASGGGRMSITMDRYQADWSMVERGWNTHVKGEGRFFTDARSAISTYREEGCSSDQYLPPFVIERNGRAVGEIKDGDSVIFFNFRGDRAIEISMAFEMEQFPYFNRGRKPDVMFAGMLQYDGDLKIPGRYLVNPPEIHETLTQVLSENGIREYAVSETQKYGHVTYFWNGNRSGKINEELEDYHEITSDKVPFEQRPWMKAAEVADEFINAMESNQYQFLRCNFANGDMVGHTGNLPAAKIAVECVDLQLARIKECCDRNRYVLMVVADHGNADQMLEKKKDGSVMTRTAHSLNPVPFIVCAPGVRLKSGEWGLANVAPTILDMLHIEKPLSWSESLIESFISVG